MHRTRLSRAWSSAGPVVAGKLDEGATIRVEAALPERADNTKSLAYITAPQGLFPAPIHSSALDKGAAPAHLSGCLYDDPSTRFQDPSASRVLRPGRLLQLPRSWTASSCWDAQWPRLCRTTACWTSHCPMSFTGPRIQFCCAPRNWRDTHLCR